MRNWIVRSLGAAALALSLSLGLVVSTPAQAATRAELKAAATTVAYEKVGGSNYAKYKAKYPKALNWGNDGCSVPNVIYLAPGVAAVVKAYGSVFEKSCDRHDFGYRNFGKNTKDTPGPHPKFSPTRATKDKIDSRFYSNMKAQCDSKFGGTLKAPLRAACKGAAKTFYEAVSRFGDKAFFG